MNLAQEKSGGWDKMGLDEVNPDELDDNGEPLEVLVTEHLCVHCTGGARAQYNPHICEAIGHHKGEDVMSCEGYVVDCADFKTRDGKYRCEGQRVRAA